MEVAKEAVVRAAATAVAVRAAVAKVAVVKVAVRVEARAREPGGDLRMEKCRRW